MVIVFKPNASQEQIKKISDYLQEQGFEYHFSQGKELTIIGIIGDTKRLSPEFFIKMEGVSNAFRIQETYKLCSRTFHPRSTRVKIGDINIGGNDIAVMAGPCSIENKPMIYQIAREVRRYGANIIRGGAFKPRSSPYAFQGLGEEGLRYLRAVGDETGCPVVSEIMAINDIPLFEKYVDIIQIGARNMQNFALLKELAHMKKPILLKRGISATIEEWLNSAEYLASKGNQKIILCERGIRTFENSTRFTLDLSSVPVIKRKSHLPIIVDPSHPMGQSDLVIPMARAAVAAGADGIMVEVHHKPSEALSDGPQSLTFKQFEHLMGEIRMIAGAIGRNIAHNEA
ncbi:MAG: 3-deoxy-7-phosphoheptulonate synthase [Candidatus Neomarinimicrobiota bacterium]|jgi:3-deoxy-7-phosphoheptulonate synthase|nr:3-deoxy-7-phosphoheptulonate synthase [Candidatus Neomarinimicrobiota bacterium]MDD3966203.1 3-deoxy-7-phosphoheptulonate synthase [Candidatus Neomarinimicrobiota bacterium]MDX9779765.1 3-deoxy-7-phosphoheptulonate synthase [bacterium]